MALSGSTDPELVTFLGTLGLVPGVEVVVVEKHPFDGPLVVTVDGQDRTLGERVARQIYVTRRGRRGDSHHRPVGAPSPHDPEEARMTSILAAEGGYQEFVLEGR